MPSLRIGVNWVKLLVGLVIAVLAFAVVETAYILFNTGTSHVVVQDLDESKFGALYKKNELERAPPEVEERIAAAVREAAGDRRFLAAYVINGTHYVALLTRDLDLYHLRVKVDRGNVTIVDHMKEAPRRAVRVVEHRETTQHDNMTATLIVKYAIYEYSFRTEGGTVTIYSVGPVERRDTKELAIGYEDMLCVRSTITNWLPNEFKVCAGGIWWVEWGRSVLRFDDGSYAWESGAVQRCSFSREISDYRPYGVGVRATATWAMCPIGPTVRIAELWAYISVDYMLRVVRDGRGSSWVAIGFCCNPYTP